MSVTDIQTATENRLIIGLQDAAAKYEAARLRETAQSLINLWHDMGRTPRVELEEGGGVEWLKVPDIFAELPPTDWAIPGLQIAPGRPFMIGGYGSSMKTLATQAALVALAAGRPVWEQFRVDGPLRVRHIDAEQGEKASRKRYIRIARAMGLQPEDLGDRLELTCFPKLYLTDSDAEQRFVELGKGFDVVVCDSLRALCPGVDENSSEIREHLDKLTRASEQTGTSYGLIHHTGKPVEGRDTRAAVRGSSAIFDACGAVYLFDGKGQDPRKVTQIKTPADAEGGEVEPFYLGVEDVDSDGIPRGGVRVHHMDIEEVCQSMSPAAGFEKVKGHVLSTLRQEGPQGSRNRLVARCSGTRSRLLQAIDELIEDGAIAVVGKELRVNNDHM